MPARILVPFDDSGPAREALEYAVELFPDGEFVVVTVVDASSVPFVPNANEDATDSELQAMLERADDRVSAAESIADERDIAIETRTRIGPPAREIVEEATTNPIDHVVMGSHGRSGVRRILLGSVAEVVVRHSPVPVTVVR
ncbi:universal stress protein [Halopiger djelfimassiliensis]|uniref:universal stress protein n=1 Tax=Halopiger djelfimassiliensis TaxID=1293047 RepID=UPI000677E6E5|nr:universal stress protein [Halopiger djelfimassiliensis]